MNLNKNQTTLIKQYDLAGCGSLQALIEKLVLNSLFLGLEWSDTVIYY